MYRRILILAALAAAVVSCTLPGAASAEWIGSADGVGRGVVAGQAAAPHGSDGFAESAKCATTMLVHNDSCPIPANGSRMSEDEILDTASDYLGDGYRDMGNGRFVSADGTRQVRMGPGDLAGTHAGGPHVNFETLVPNPARPGRLMPGLNSHVYF